MFLFHYTTRFHVDRSKWEAEQILQMLTIDLRIHEYKFEQNEMGQLTATPRRTTYLVQNSFVPNIVCELEQDDIGAEIRLSFSIAKVVRIFFFVMIFLAVLFEGFILAQFISARCFDWAGLIPILIISFGAVMIFCGLRLNSHFIIKQIKKALSL